MSDYTPTTEEVRDKFSFLYPAFEGEFDRWLAEVKAQERQAERERIIKLFEDEIVELHDLDLGGYEENWMMIDSRKEAIALIREETA